LYNEVKKQNRKIDVLFANAGVAKRAPFGTVTEEFFDIHFNANVRGLFFTVRSRTKNEHRSYRAAHPTNQQLLILALDGP